MHDWEFGRDASPRNTLHAALQKKDEWMQEEQTKNPFLRPLIDYMYF